MKKKQSLINTIAAILEHGHSITTKQAYDWFDCMELPAKICQLKNVGWKIKTTRVKTPEGKTVAKYKLTNA